MVENRFFQVWMPMKVEYNKIVTRTRSVNGHYNTYNVQEKRTGEVVGFISGNNSEVDKLVIADDETKQFVKIDINMCHKID